MKLNKMKFEDVRLSLYVIAIILLALVFIGKINISCYYKNNFGFICPACGLTRATISLIKFEFIEAYNYNPFYVGVLVPLIVILCVNDIFTVIKRKIKKNIEYSIVELILGEAKNEHF